MTDHSFLEAERARVFSGEDRELYLHVGYFFTWYNNVEWKITHIMAIVMGDKDFSAFALLVSGMDARTKVRRLKSLCKIKNLLIEQSLADRLKFFEDKLCPLRNKLAHNALLNDERQPRFHYAQLERLPWKALGMDIPDGLSKEPPDHIDTITLFERGCWLHSFSDDLTKVIYCAIKQEPLGIKSPVSPLPRKQTSPNGPAGGNGKLAASSAHICASLNAIGDG
jgi:hypothetical protein